MKRTLKVLVLIISGLLLLAALTSCGRSADIMKRKAEKLGLNCEIADGTKMAYVNNALGDREIEGEVGFYVEISGQLDGKYVACTIFEFDKASAAKDFEKKHTEIIGVLGSDQSIKRSGRVVIFGSSSVIDRVW